MTLVAILLLGFFLGVRHATDADHVVAVSTIVSRTRSWRAALGVGAMWGLGHTVTLLVVGGAIVLFGLVIPPRVGLSLELSVAVMLVLLGVANVVSTARRMREVVGDAPPAEERAPLAGSRWRWLRPLVVGVVHGLAGSAAVALLVLATLRDARWAVLYLLLFGVGTLGGMALLTLMMSLPLSAASRRFSGFGARLPTLAGVASIAFGLVLAYEIGVVQGLFTGHPR